MNGFKRKSIQTASALATGTLLLCQPALAAKVTRPDPPQFTQSVSAELAATGVMAVPSIGRLPRGHLIYLTGDGGWNTFDKYLVYDLAQRGLSGFVLPTDQYFAKARTPEEAAGFLGRLIESLPASTVANPSDPSSEGDVILVGWSFGADVLPAMVNRLPPQLRQRIRSVSLLGLSAAVPFQVALAEQAGHTSSADRLVLPEIENLRVPHLMCLMGQTEKRSACPSISPGKAHLVTVPGSHGFNGDDKLVAAAIVSTANYYD
jgi:type IV secretory pathway VirJ component